MAKTFDDIKGLFYPLVGGGAEGSNAFFTSTQVTNWCNKALRELAEDTLCLDAVNTGTFLQDEESFSLSTGHFYVWRVEFDDEVACPITLHRLSSKNRQWRDVTGEPRYWYIDGFASSSADNTDIGGWPIPSTDYDYRVYSYAYPTAVSDAADTTPMEMPDWVHLGVVCSMVADALSAETAIQNLGAAAVYRRVFVEAKDRLRQRSFSKLHKRRAMGSHGTMRFNVWNQLPSLVPEP